MGHHLEQDNSLFQMSTSVMLLIDSDSGEIVDANPAALRFYGYEHERITTMRIADINTLDPDEIHEEMQRARRQERRYFEFQHRLADGSVRDVHSYTSPIDRDGRRFLYSIIQDMTDEKRSEGEARLRSAALEAAANGVVITKLDGTIEWVNEAFTRMTGYGLDEVRGRNPRLLKSGRTPEGLYRELWETVTAGRVWRGELTNRRKDGSHYVEEQTVTPVRNALGAITHLVAIKQDITAAKQTQEEIVRRIAQQHAVAEVGQLALQGTAIAGLMERVVESVARVLDVEYTAVLQFVASKQAFIPRAAVGWEDRVGGRVEIPNDGTTQAGFTLLNDAPVIIDDVRAETRFILPPELVERDVVSGMSVVIDNGMTPFGVLSAHTARKRRFTDHDAAFLQAMSNTLAATIRQRRAEHWLKASNQRLVEAYDATIEGWAKALDLRDHETEGHSRRVTELSVALAAHLGLDEGELVNVRRGALLHDIGKMGVPDTILKKPAPLTEEEWELMRAHTTHAFDLLSSIPFLRGALEIPYCHHERWDGSGYPRGLKEEAIPFAARIFAVVDVFDALTSDRPYRAAWTREAALAHIRTDAGTHFDPVVVGALMEHMESLDEVEALAGEAVIRAPTQK